jgi:hypothetical protein
MLSTQELYGAALRQARKLHRPHSGSNALEEEYQLNNMDDDASWSQARRSERIIRLMRMADTTVDAALAYFDQGEDKAAFAVLRKLEQRTRVLVERRDCDKARLSLAAQERAHGNFSQPESPASPGNEEGGEQMGDQSEPTEDALVSATIFTCNRVAAIGHMLVGNPAAAVAAISKSLDHPPALFILELVPDSRGQDSRGTRPRVGLGPGLGDSLGSPVSQ